MASILVVDDEASMREFLEILLRKQGHEVSTAADLASATARCASGDLDLVITDLRLGRDTGLDVLKAVKADAPATEVVMITAFATADNAVEAMKLGAFHYVTKPFKKDEMLLVVEKALERRALVAENRALAHKVGGAQVHELIGTSPAIEEVRQLIDKVAPARTTILVSGESGTGKEVVARAIHARSGRADAPFVAINCAAIPEGLIESELFGHERGSFTGASELKTGLFEVAGSGTLFLDEVGELPPAVQVKLLRALQERRIRRVGGSRDLPVAARIVAATNRELAEEVKAGRFREDLYYRLNVINLRLPALRERREDVALFLAYFLERISREHGRPAARFTPEAERLLLAWDYPGNVRELVNLVERAVTLADGPEIGVSALPPGMRSGTAAAPADGAAPVAFPDGGLDLQGHLDAVERGILVQALARTGGNKTEAARLLHIEFRSLRYRLDKFGIGKG